MSGKPTVISLFAGGGGSSLGYQMAGYNELLAVEFDSNAVKTLEANFPDLKIYAGDIKKLSGNDCLKLAGIKKGELDVLDGSPPCQGFSSSGKRNVNDSRNDLFKEYVRLINCIQPKIFVMENVKGMIKGKMKGRFIEILKEIRSTGYNVKCKLMNSMWYGVPQSRERLIFIGVRSDIDNIIQFPDKLKSKPITVKQAIKNIKNINFAPLPKGHEEVFPQITQGESAINCVDKKTLEKYIPRMIKNKKYEFGNICKRLHNNRPAPTITKTFINYSEPPIHPEKHRVITIEEAKLLTSFPEEYIFVGKFTEQWARIGNSVPPKMMYHIAKTIKEKMLCQNINK